MSERRKSPRVVVDLPVRVTIEEVTVPGHLRDICRDAALVEVHHRCAIGLPVRLGWDTGTGAVEVAGAVIRLDQGEGDAQGIAILFSGATPAAATAIELLIDSKSR